MCLYSCVHVFALVLHCISCSPFICCVVSHLSPPFAPPMLDLCCFSCACPSSPRRQYRRAHPDSTGGEETARQSPAPTGRGPRYAAYMTKAQNKCKHRPLVCHINILPNVMCLYSSSPIFSIFYIGQGRDDLIYPNDFN